MGSVNMPQIDGIVILDVIPVRYHILEELFYQTGRHHIPEDNNLQLHHRDNLKFNLVQTHPMLCKALLMLI
jgi:hypothetical protein